MEFFKRKLSASQGIVATTANAIWAVYDMADEDSAIHFAAIVLALGNEHAVRLGIPTPNPDELMKNVWKVASCERPELIKKYIAFMLLSTRALGVWGHEDYPEKAYYERHYSKFVDGVSFEEFEQFYDNLAAAFEAMVEIEQWNWTFGR